MVWRVGCVRLYVQLQFATPCVATTAIGGKLVGMPSSVCVLCAYLRCGHYQPVWLVSLDVYDHGHFSHMDPPFVVPSSCP